MRRIGCLAQAGRPADDGRPRDRKGRRRDDGTGINAQRTRHIGETMPAIEIGLTTSMVLETRTGRTASGQRAGLAGPLAGRRETGQLRSQPTGTCFARKEGGDEAADKRYDRRAQIGRRPQASRQRPEPRHDPHFERLLQDSPMRGRAATDRPGRSPIRLPWLPWQTSLADFPGRLPWQTSLGVPQGTEVGVRRGRARRPKRRAPGQLARRAVVRRQALFFCYFNEFGLFLYGIFMGRCVSIDGAPRAQRPLSSAAPCSARACIGQPLRPAPAPPLRVFDAPASGRRAQGRKGG
jgi:hypothetical protein